MTLPSIPHVEQYDGLWLIHGPSLQDRINQVNTMDLAAHVQARLGGAEPVSARNDDDRFEVVNDNIAVVSIEGAMTKYGSSLSRADATVELRRSIRAAADDGSVKGIMLRIDSPGGTVAGTSDLAEDVARAKKIKPVHAYIEDTGASAAYWVASQASRISSNRTAIVGSIGTYGYLIDYSGNFAEPGNGAGPIKVIEIKSTLLKGTGIAPGAEISDEQIENMQRELNEINAEFTSAVQRGRGFSDEQIKLLADARVHIGTNAVSLGLIDAVGTMDDAIEQLSKSINGRRTVRSSGTTTSETGTETMPRKKTSGFVKPSAEKYDEDEMLEDEDDPRSEEEHDEEAIDDEEDEQATEDEEKSSEDEKKASVRRLKAVLPDSDAEFREECIERGMSVRQAKDAWMDTLRARLESRESETTKRPRPGVKRLRSTGTKPEANGDVREQIAEKRDRLIATGMDRAKAHAKVMRENPDLRAAYVEAANSKPRRKR